MQSRADASALKEAVADLTFENQQLKRARSAWGDHACVIQLPRSSRSSSWSNGRICRQKRALEKLGIPRATFYNWYDRDLALGEAGLDDRRANAGSSGTASPTKCAGRSSTWPLEEPGVSPRELAVRLTDKLRYFGSEASAHPGRPLDMAANPAIICATIPLSLHRLHRL